MVYYVCFPAVRAVISYIIQFEDVRYTTASIYAAQRAKRHNGKRLAQDNTVKIA